MNYNYIAGGSIHLGGCSDYKSWAYVYWRYAINSIVFSKPAALKGKYEVVAIKEVVFTPQSNMCRACNYTPMYKDSYNALWDEQELVPYSEAVDIIDNYYLRMMDAIQKNTLNCE
jgi:hypothetical protein